MDGTQRREEATDIEEEEEEEEAADQEDAGAPAAAKAVSSMPVVVTSPNSSLAEPPGFSPVRDGPSAPHVLELSSLNNSCCLHSTTSGPCLSLELHRAAARQLMQCSQDDDSQRSLHIDGLRRASHSTVSIVCQGCRADHRQA